MLAPSFKTAKQLGISDRYLAALQKVLVMLETEKMRAWPDLTTFHGEKVGFHMAFWHTWREDVETNTCGTAMCIGGMVECLIGDEVTKTTTPLEYLYWPDLSVAERTNVYQLITLDHAIQALRNYLVTGAPRWHEILDIPAAGDHNFTDCD